MLAPDKGTRELRHVCLADRAQRGKSPSQTREHRLEQPLGHGEVLQPRPAQVDELDLRARAHQRARHRGDDDLPAVGDGGDACRAVDVETHVPVARALGLACVDSDPDAERNGLRPDGRAELGLDPRRRPDRRDGTGERDEE